VSAPRASAVRRWSLSLLALLGIAVIIVGLPLVLLAAGAPFAGDGPFSLHQAIRSLTSPDDGTFVVDLIKVAGWVSWAVLTISLLLEILARARGIRVPQLPGLLGLPQAAARGLIGTVMLAGAALPTGTGIAHAATFASSAPISATHIPGAGTHTNTSSSPRSTAATTAAASRSGDEQTRTVNHTVVHGETLWSIARDHLGDGRRYPEIVALNEHRLHGQGSFLRPGWVLRVPVTPQAPGDAGSAQRSVVIRPGDTLSGIAQQHLGVADRYPEIVHASRNITQPGGRHLTDADEIRPGWTVHLPAPTPSPSSPSAHQRADHPTQDAALTQHAAPTAPVPASARPSPATPPPSTPTPSSRPTTTRLPEASTAPGKAAGPAATTPPPTSAAAGSSPATSVPAATTVTAPTQDQAGAHEQDEHLQERPAWATRTGFGVGALLAAGLVTLVAGRRRTQQRRRRPGQRLPVSPAPAARMEQELRATADALSVETVDSALRALARTCIDTDVSLPVVRAARLTATQFDLYLALPAHLPAPWAGTDDATVWSLAVTAAAELLEGDDDDEDDVPAPYPTLVTIGHDDEDGHVLLDLEYLGALGVIGDGEATREVLAALAIELATSIWADDLQVTLVGAFPELEDTLQTGRIRYLPSVGRILQELQLRAEQDRQALADDGAADLHTARVTGAAPDAWSPEIVLLAGDITASQQAQLQDLLTQTPRVAIAAVTSGIRVGAWGLDLTAGDSPDLAILAPIGLQLRPQRVPAEQYGLLLELASLTDLEELTDGDPAAGAGDTPAGEPSLADVEAVAPVTDPIRPASAMPEVTLQVLTAVAARDASSAGEQTSSGPSPSAVPVITGVFLPPSARAEAGLGHAEAPADPVPGPDGTAASVAGTPARDEHPERHPGLDRPGPAPRHPDQAEGPDDDESVDEAVDEAGTDEATTTQTTNTTNDPAAGPDRGPAEGPGDEPGVPPAPRILVLGPVDIAHAGGKVEPSKRARLLELAAYLALNPGATHTAIDDAIWPDRRTEDNTNTRNPATSKLRRWVATDPAGQEYLPRHQAGGGYAFLPTVTTDVGDWDAIVGHDPLRAATEDLEAGLQLVRGIPFEGCHRRRYAWAEPLRQRLISEIVDASYELARRRLMEGRWRAAESAVVVGLRIEPAQEHLWRLRILAAHESRNPAAEQEAIDRLLTITEQLECELEPETEQLLTALAAGADLQQIMAKAL
jgi:DNA-binding SARP family transcriptional activator/LysM repeat protein